MIFSGLTLGIQAIFYHLVKLLVTKCLVEPVVKNKVPEG